MRRLGIAYVGVGFMLVVIILLAVRVARHEAKQETALALRVAKVEAQQEAEHLRRVANATADYRRCKASIPVLRRIGQHLSGVNELADVIALNAAQVARATPQSDPTREARLASLARILKARTKIGRFKALEVPTLEKCKEDRKAALASA